MKTILLASMFVLVLAGCSVTTGSNECFVLEAGDADAVSESLGRQLLAHQMANNC